MIYSLLCSSSSLSPCEADKGRLPLPFPCWFRCGYFCGLLSSYVCYYGFSWETLRGPDEELYCVSVLSSFCRKAWQTLVSAFNLCIKSRTFCPNLLRRWFSPSWRSSTEEVGCVQWAVWLCVWGSQFWTFHIRSHRNARIRLRGIFLCVSLGHWYRQETSAQPLLIASELIHTLDPCVPPDFSNNP